MMRPRYGFLCLLVLLLSTAAAVTLPAWFLVLPVLFIGIFLLFFPKKAVPALALLIVFLLEFLHVLVLPGVSDEALYNVTLTGTVAEASCTDTVQTVVLDHVTVEGTTAIPVRRVRVSPIASGPEPGDRITVVGSLYGIDGEPENPGELSYVLSNRADGLSHTVSAGEVTVIGHEDRLGTVMFRLRKAIKLRIDAVMPDRDTASVMFAMLTGDRQAVSDETSDAFSAAGVSHLLAVSGLHVGILLSLLSALFFLKKRFRWLKLAVITVFLLFYCCLTGFAPSILRASLMAFLLSLTSALGWRYDPLNALGWAGTAILLINPLRMFDLSFQLSFAATFGIIAFGTSAGKQSSRILSLLRVSLAAATGTLPMILRVFASQPVLLLLANLLLVPLATLALSLLAVLLLPSFIFPELTFLATPAYYPAYLLLSLCRLLARGPQVVFRPLPVVAVVLLMVLLLFFSRYILIKKKRIAAAVLSVLLVFCLIGSAALTANRVTVAVLSVSSGKLPVHLADPDGDVLVSPTNDAALARYLTHYTGRLKAVFLLSQEDAEAFAKLDLPADTVYAAPGVTYPGQTELLTENTIVSLRESVIRYENGGLVLHAFGRTLLLGGSGDFPVDLAVGESADAPIRIMRRGTENDPSVYPTKLYGCVRCRISRRGLSVIPFHEATS